MSTWWATSSTFRSVPTPGAEVPRVGCRLPTAGQGTALADGDPGIRPAGARPVDGRPAVRITQAAGLCLAQMDRVLSAGADDRAAGLALAGPAAHAARHGHRMGATHRALLPWNPARLADRAPAQWLADEFGRRSHSLLVRHRAAAGPPAARSGPLRAPAHAASLAGLGADGRGHAPSRSRCASRRAAPRRHLPPHVAVPEIGGAKIGNARPPQLALRSTPPCRAPVSGAGARAIGASTGVARRLCRRSALPG